MPDFGREKMTSLQSKQRSWIIVILILIFVAVGVYSNVKEQRLIDHSKLPSKVEESVGFQRWITNLRNKGLATEADEFMLAEENEIYNTKWLNIYSLDEPGKQVEYNDYISSHKNIKKIVFSPSEHEFLDYRNVERDGYFPNEVHFYGLKEDKIIDARILDCSARANCYFDRAYFLSNDLFVISEISRDMDKKDTSTPSCDINSICTYTIKLHLIDLINNKRYVYESKPFEVNLWELMGEI